MEWSNIVISRLNCCVKQIDTNRYNDYKITDILGVLTLNLKEQVRLELSVTVYFKYDINK